MPLELHAEVFLTAYGAYAAVVMAVLFWNASEARRASRRLDETRPGRHVLHEGRAQALIGQVFGRDR